MAIAYPTTGSGDVEPLRGVRKSVMCAARSAPGTVDVAIVGGGLAGGLLALKLAETRPQYSVALLERGAWPGGVHTWSFHDTDLDATQRRWVSRFVDAAWPRHAVRFASYARTIESGYASIRSPTFARIVAEALGPRLRCGTSARWLTADRVELEGGGALHARLVIDARGARQTKVPVAWQKFVGLELELATPHQLAHPVLMDAAVPQEDGFRFLYVLPWTPTRLLVEDTRYSERADIDAECLRRDVLEYARRQGWRVEALIAQEMGALPLPLGGRFDDAWPDDGVVRIGVGAGLGHPTTGYSLADAVATADLLATRDLSDPGGVYRSMRDFAQARWEARAFYRLLNRLLFRAAVPARRAAVLEHFYRKPAAVVARFYAGQLTAGDRLRILCGRPPVPLLAAARALSTSAVK